MAKFTTKYRMAAAAVDEAIASLEKVPRSFGGHRHGVEDHLGVVRPFFRRGDLVKLRGERGEFRGLIGHGGALVNFGARGKRVVPVRLLERA